MIGSEWLAYSAALVMEADGDVAGAWVVLDLTTQAILAAGAPALLVNPAGDAVRLALAVGETDGAGVLVEAMQALGRRTRSPVVHGTTAWVEGLVARDPDVVARGAAELTATARGPEGARALHDAAVVAATNGRDDDAREWARDAFGRYDALGADHLHTRLRAELRAAGVVMRPRRRAPRPATGWDALTPSEGTIVELLGGGATNSEIADQLCVSRRTVESHLSHVYAKVGLSTRTQLVAAAARREAP